MQEVLAVGVALGAVAENAAVDRRAGNIQHAQALDDRFVERLAVKAIRLAQEQLHHLGFALQALARRLRRGAGLFRAGGFDHGGLLHFDQAISDHLVEIGQKRIHPRRRVSMNSMRIGRCSASASILGVCI